MRMRSMARQKVVTAVLITGPVVYLRMACATAGFSRPQLTVSLRADSAEIHVGGTQNTYFARIGFEYLNTSASSLSSLNDCGFPHLERKVNGEWVKAFRQEVWGCGSGDFVLRSGASYREALAFWPDRRQFGPVEGVYRTVAAKSLGCVSSDQNRPQLN